MQLLDTLSSFFVSTASAATTVTTAPQQSGGMSLMVMLGIFIVFMYFAMWRPQSKRAKEHRQLIQSLAKGDEVMTAGGMLGTVSKITDQHIVLTLNEGVDVTLQKSSIVTVLPKGTLKSI